MYWEPPEEIPGFGGLYIRTAKLASPGFRWIDTSGPAHQLSGEAKAEEYLRDFR